MGGQTGTEKYFPLVGDVCPYGEAYQGGMGDRRGPEKMVRFGTNNIRSRRNGVLESAICGLAQGQFDCGVL